MPINIQISGAIALIFFTDYFSVSIRYIATCNW
jgi:hypothetical protein